MALQFDGVLLDLDGLLLDTQRLQFQVGPTVLKELGYELDTSFFRRLVGIDPVTSARLISAELNKDIDVVELDRAWNSAIDQFMEEGVPLRPHVPEFFQALDRHSLPRAVATNSLTGRAEWKLEHAGLLNQVDAVIGVDKVEPGKPAPDVYLAAAYAIGLAPGQCVALDDSDLGIQAALEAGVATVIQVPDQSKSLDKRAHHEASSLAQAQIILGL